MVSKTPQTGIEGLAEEFERGRGDGDAEVLQPTTSELSSSRHRRKPAEATVDTWTERRGIPARILVAGSDLLAGALASALEVYGYATKNIVLREPEIQRGREWCPNLVILDVRSLDVASGTALIDQLRRARLQVCVIDAAGDDDRLDAWTGAGTSALIDGGEPFDQLFRTINRLLRKGSVEPTTRRSSPSLDLTPVAQQPQDPWLQNFAILTERERVVLAELMEGHCAEEIATAGFVSISTVRSQIKAILQKLGVNSQLAAVALARRADWSLDIPVRASPKPNNRRTHAF